MKIVRVRFRDSVTVQGLGECTSLTDELAEMTLADGMLRARALNSSQAVLVPFANCLFCWDEAQRPEPQTKRQKKV
jgi:hypothetical protein